MTRERTWDVEEEAPSITERQPGRKMQAAASSAVLAFAVMGICAVAPPVSVRAISAASSPVRVVEIVKRPVPRKGSAGKRAPGQFEPDVGYGISTPRLARMMPAFVRLTDSSEIDEVDLPPL